MNPFSEKSNLEYYEKLVTEYHSINIHEQKVEFSEELSSLYKESRSVTNFWRQFYKIPINDTRYLSITLSEIYYDYLLIKLYEFSGFYDSNQTNTNIPNSVEEYEELVKDELNSIIKNHNNYYSKGLEEELVKEKEELLNSYNQTNNLPREIMKRLTEIRSRETEDDVKEKSNNENLKIRKR